MYLLLFAFPLGLLSFLVAVIFWSISLGFVTAPIWYYAIPAEHRGTSSGRAERSTPAWSGRSIVGVGVILLFLTPWLVRAVVSFDALLMRALLGPTRGELERAAARSAEQRDLAVAAAALDRRQIERDLHDGAQARLVALAVDLGRARRRLEEGGSQEEAADLVRTAHEEAKQALARDPRPGARHPSRRPDRPGTRRRPLRAGRPLPVSVTLTSQLGTERPAEQAEAAAYFVVAEALDQRRPAQRRRARRGLGRARRRLPARRGARRRRRRRRLRTAPAWPGSTTGSRSLGGSLAVESPAGGPTSITAVIPCG